MLSTLLRLGLPSGQIYKTSSVAFNPEANCTDPAAITCRRSECQLLLAEGVAWSAQRNHMTDNICVLGLKCYFLFK
jgi:hypothetical protein